MSKNLLNIYESGDYEDYLDSEAEGAMRANRAPKGRTGQKDQKRLRDSYIGANKKNGASRAARMAKFAADGDSSPQDRKDAGMYAELEKEICGKN